MRRWMALGASAALMLAACGDDGAEPHTPPWDGHGVVTAHQYDDPDDWTTTSSTCWGRDKYGNCTMKTYETHHHHDPAHWYLQATDESGREHKLEVTQAQYNGCRLGALVLNGQTCQR